MIRSLTLALALALGLSPLLALAPGAAQAQPKLLLEPKPSGGYLDWSRTWATNVGVSVGLPAPTNQCVAASSGGDMTCTPTATQTKTGVPTTVEAGFWPLRYAVSYPSSSVYATFGNIADSAGRSMSTCVAMRPHNLLAQSTYFITKFATGEKQWSWLRYSTYLYLDAHKSDGTSTLIAVANALALNQFTVSCAAYEWISDGASKMRMNANGTAAAEVTNAVGPLPASTAPVRFGSAEAASAGDDIVFWAHWDNVAFSDAQLADLVGSLQGKVTTRPRDGNVTVTSAASLCNPAGTATGPFYQIPANTLCCHSTGCDVFPAVMHGNTLLQSRTIATASAPTSPWAVNNSGCAAPTVLADQSTAPDGTLTADRVSFPTCAATGSNYSQLYQPFTGTAATWSHGLYVKKVSGTGTVVPIRFGLSTSAEAGTVLCTVNSSTWTLCEGSGTLTATSWYYALGTAYFAPTTEMSDIVVDIWEAKAIASPLLGPPVTTVAGTVAGTADVVTEPNGVSNYASMWYGIKATLDGSPTSSRGLLTVGTYGGNNSLPMYISAAGFVTCAARDVTTATRLVSISSPAAGSGPHTYICGYDGEPRLFLDGVAATNYSGSLATITAVPIPATVQVGAALYTLGGKVYRVCQGDSYAVVNACLNQ